MLLLSILLSISYRYILKELLAVLIAS